MRRTMLDITALATGTLLLLQGCGGGEELDPLIVTTTEDVADAADDQNSLREALVYASENGGTITFTEEVTGTITLGSEVVIDGSASIVVEGPGADVLTIAGSGEHRHIDVANNALTISGLTFTGGAVLSGGSGGSIRAVDADLVLTDTVFTKNKQQYIIGNGGALSLEGTSSLSVTGSAFTENTTNDYGGAIYIESTGGATLDDVAFSKNGPSEDGEEVWGSAIYDAHGELTVTNATFDANVGDRGTVHVVTNEGTVALTDVTFTNHAADYGGGLFLDSLAEELDTVKVTVTRGTFTDNTAKTSGAAISASFSIDLTLEDCTFERNASKGSGGAISSSGSVLVKNSTFTGNSAIAGAEATVPSNGGAIDVGGLSNLSRLTLEEVTFDDNEADGEGGAVYAIFSNVVSVTGSTFTNNSAKDAGAAVLSVVGDGNTTTVTDSTFTGNTATSRGGALFFGAPTTLTGTTVSGNTAEFGGGIQTGAGGPLTIGAGSSVTGNTATHVKDSPDELVGGGICNDDEVLGDVSLVSGNSPDDLCSPDMGD